MGRASKRKLSKEELKEENKRLRQKIAEGSFTPEDSKRIVNILSTRNLKAYALVVFLPPIGIWYVWTRREQLYLNIQSCVLWTFVGSVIFINYVGYLINMLHG